VLLTNEEYGGKMGENKNGDRIKKRRRNYK
jgi:hypothetical protein